MAVAKVVQRRIGISSNVIDALLRSGQYSKAADYIQETLRSNDRDHVAWFRLAKVETHRRRFRVALECIDRALALNSVSVAYRRLKGIILANQRASAEAIKVLTPVVEGSHDDFAALNALQTSHYLAGDVAKAISLGTLILELQNRLAKSASSPKPGQVNPSQSEKPRKRVIAFSLWGVQPSYNYGAMINARLARFIYPGWTCRFYLDRNVPKLTVAMLKQAGAETVFPSMNQDEVPRACWRFLVADDTEVDVFLCRDCDARLTPKEAAAVDDWLRSGRSFHVMRDNVLHKTVVLAGLWGGKTNPSLRIRERMRRYFARGADERYGADQGFLANEIWPAIRQDCIIHDSYYHVFDALPFPAFGKGVDRNHVGMGVIGDKVLRHEAALFGLPWTNVKNLS